MTDWRRIAELREEQAAMWRQVSMQLTVITVIMSCTAIIMIAAL